MAKPYDQKLLGWVAYPAAAVVLYSMVANWGFWRSDPEILAKRTVPRVVLQGEDMPGMALLVDSLWNGANTNTPARVRARMELRNHGVYVGVRDGGRLRASAWKHGGRVLGALHDGLAETKSQLSDDQRGTIDTIEICIAHSFRDLRIRSMKRFLGNIHRGVRGLELYYKDHVVRVSPIEMIARNLSFRKALEDLMNEYELGPGDLSAGLVSAKTFECEQILVRLGPPVTATLMLRGNEIVRPEEVTRERVGELKRLLGDYLLANLHPDGRMTYKWWPSRGEEADSNNMIRQWMATIALVRLGNDRNDPAIHARAAANIRYNLDKFYRVEDGHGLIEYRGKVKLGAVSLAALAIAEHPQRAEFAEYEKALVATTFYLQQDNGRFRTFYKPKGLDGQHNFYAGETMLLWAKLYKRDRDPELLERFMRSFRYYRTWHRENRNPAFVPWQSQADTIMFDLTGDTELRDFVFEIDDWLLSMQEWDDSRYPDVKGRFYDDDRRYYGPPHASATGVYLEGLIDAHRLARELGDRERQEAYRVAIARGLRSVIQLQFQDEVDMFYVHQRDRVRGGVRTTVYDNAIRVDNVQHNLLGIFRIFKQFAESDYRL